MANGEGELLTLAEASERIDVSVSTLRKQAESGTLRAFLKGRTWLVYAYEADRYAREHKGKPGRKPRTPTA